MWAHLHTSRLIYPLQRRPDRRRCSPTVKFCSAYLCSLHQSSASNPSNCGFTRLSSVSSCSYMPRVGRFRHDLTVSKIRTSWGPTQRQQRTSNYRKPAPPLVPLTSINLVSSHRRCPDSAHLKAFLAAEAHVHFVLKSHIFH